MTEPTEAFNQSSEKTEASAKVAPPAAKKVPYEHVLHGDTRQDPYSWLRDDNWEHPENMNPEIIAHLEAENAYTASQLEASKELAEQIGNELISRIVPNQSSVPAKDGAFEYWYEYRPDGNYPVYMRRPSGTTNTEIYFDEDKESEGHEFFDIGGISHSPDHKYIAYSLDTDGSESYTIRIRELATGKEFPAAIAKTGGYCVWSADSKTIYYTELDDKHRSKTIKSHKLGSDTVEDKIVYHEQEEIFSVGVSKTKSGKYILINSVASSSQTSEARFFDAAADAATADIKIISPRQKGVKYAVTHRDDTFYFLTNKNGAVENKVMTAPVDNCAQENWVDYYPARANVTIESLVPLKDYIIRMERENALQRVVVSDYAGNEFTVDFPDGAYAIGADTGYEFDTQKIRVNYQSPANPGALYEVDLDTRNKTVLKKKELPNGHDPSEYVVERFSIKARDGAEVPVTLLRHKSVKPDGTAPLFQYGYGSYGIPSEPNFRSSAISFADRGLVYAIAHVRGGSDKGKSWYFDGKKMNKINTFTDFIDVTEALIEKGYGKKGEVIMEGGSAGGLLMGAVVNMRPDLYGVVNADVAFVDALTTICDETLPLTPGEWEEWGDPIRNKEVYDYMKSYSPYDNVRKDVAYPVILAPAGLSDPRVTYWEMTKWIARLRDLATGGPFLLKMNMNAGHGGKTGRYDVLREAGVEYAHCLQQLVDKFGHNLSLRVNYTTRKNEQAVTAPASKQAPAL